MEASTLLAKIIELTRIKELRGDKNISVDSLALFFSKDADEITECARKLEREGHILYTEGYLLPRNNHRTYGKIMLL